LLGLFSKSKNPSLDCVTLLPLTMGACDAVASAVSGERGILPYAAPDNGSRLHKSLVDAGVPKGRAGTIVSALSRIMLGVPRSLGKDPRSQEIIRLMKVCPGALTSKEAQIRAWNMGPTEGMAQCLATTMVARGAEASSSTQYLFGWQPTEANMFLAWGAPSPLGMEAASLFGAPVAKALQVGRRHYKAGHFDKAAAAYEHAVRADPSNWRALAGMGSSKLRSGDPRGAAEAFNAAVRFSPRNPSLYALLGDALADQGAFDQAMGSYRQALNLKPGHKHASASLAKIEERKRLAEGRMWRAKGRKHYLAKQFKIAASSYEKAAAALPDNAAAFAGLAASKLALGDVAGAVDAYKRSLDLEANHSMRWTQYGVALRAAGDQDKAKEALARALELDPNNRAAQASIDLLNRRASADALANAANEGPRDALVDSLLGDPLQESGEEGGEETARLAAEAKALVEGGSPPPSADGTAAAPLTAAAPVIQDSWPDLPSREDVIAAMRPLQPQLAACEPSFHGRVMFSVTVSGPRGAVGEATIQDPPANLKEKDCMLEVVRGASFRNFKKDALEIAYPYQL
ncbi:MAG: tetratricopeptide repeat protein, partial [Myxococcales bacterium]|nr:tetratricopeptide repeat protein [Myxococcales bacterium]